jgi:hypothetical protein
MMNGSAAAAQIQAHYSNNQGSSSTALTGGLQSQ